MSRFQQWWARIPTADPVQQRQAPFFQLVLAGWLILGLIGFPLGFLRGGGDGANALPMPTDPFIIALLLLLLASSVMLWLTPLIALILLRRGRFARAVVLACWGLLIAHSIAAYAIGIGDASVPIVYFLPIALAGLLAGRRMLIVTASYSIFAVVAIGLLQMQSPPLAGLFTLPITGPVPADSLGQTIGFFMAVTLIISLLLDRFGGALHAALDESLRREADLHMIRGSLEAAVTERTAELGSALQDAQRRAAEKSHLLEEIAQQREMIRELSVPILPVSRDTLVMPLVGAFDTVRLMEIQEQALGKIETTRARYLLLDITGVPIVDTQVAKGLLNVVQATRLLGAQTILVGVRPEVAQSVVGLGLDLSSIETYNDLQSALGRTGRRG